MPRNFPKQFGSLGKRTKKDRTNYESLWKELFLEAANSERRGDWSFNSENVPDKERKGKFFEISSNRGSNPFLQTTTDNRFHSKHGAAITKQKVATSSIVPVTTSILVNSSQENWTSTMGRPIGTNPRDIIYVEGKRIDGGQTATESEIDPSMVLFNSSLTRNKKPGFRKPVQHDGFLPEMDIKTNGGGTSVFKMSINPDSSEPHLYVAQTPLVQGQHSNQELIGWLAVLLTPILLLIIILVLLCWFCVSKRRAKTKTRSLQQSHECVSLLQDTEASGREHNYEINVASKTDSPRLKGDQFFTFTIDLDGRTISARPCYHYSESDYQSTTSSCLTAAAISKESQNIYEEVPPRHMTKHGKKMVYNDKGDLAALPMADHDISSDESPPSKKPLSTKTFVETTRRSKASNEFLLSDLAESREPKQTVAKLKSPRQSPQTDSD